MNNPDHSESDRRARDIFLRALKIQLPEARAAYLEGTCQEDVALRSRVEALLERHHQDSFPETSTVSEPRAEIEPKPMLEAPCPVIGRYKLLEKIVEGGCGVVYVAGQTATARRRAVASRSRSFSSAPAGSQ